MRRTLIFLFFIQLTAFAQQSKIDSLSKIVRSNKPDTNTVNALNLIAREYWGPDPKLARAYSDSALHSAQKIKFSKGIANAYSNIGNVNHFMGNYDSALYYHLKSLKLYETIQYEKGVANAYNNIANVYYRMDKDEISLEYHQRSLAIHKKLNHLKGIALSLNNIGNLLLQQTKYDEAMKYYEESLKYRRQLGDKNDIFQSLNNLGLLYSEQEDYAKALDYNFQSLKIKEELNDQTGIAISKANIGTVYRKMKRYDLAIEYLNKSLTSAKNLGLKDFTKECYAALATAYSEMKDYKKAFEYYTLFSMLKDSIYTSESNKQIAEMQTLYESEKKDKEIQLLQKDGEIQQTRALASSKKQKMVIYSVSSILLLALCFSIFVLRSYRQKQKANIEISHQKEVIEEKSKEITDSIHYAKRIQQALLASDSFLKKQLNDYFIFYKPKDIVSGDFYWANIINNKFVFITADCTGHGVPGAFMSLLNISYLNEAIIEKKIDSPDKILDFVRGQIIHSLNPEGADIESKDGMDAALCMYDFNKMKLQFACANNPLWLIRNNLITEYAPDKMPVGSHYGDLKEFSLNTIELQKDDIIYTFTDGYADQFGGPKGKKFKYKQFQQILLDNHKRPMAEQRLILEKAITEWQGSLEQIDDVLVVGIRI